MPYSWYWWTCAVTGRLWWQGTCAEGFVLVLSTTPFLSAVSSAWQITDAEDNTKWWTSNVLNIDVWGRLCAKHLKGQGPTPPPAGVRKTAFKNTWTSQDLASYRNKLKKQMWLSKDLRDKYDYLFVWRDLTLDSTQSQKALIIFKLVLLLLSILLAMINLYSYF